MFNWAIQLFKSVSPRKKYFFIKLEMPALQPDLSFSKPKIKAYLFKSAYLGWDTCAICTVPKNSRE
jgi:hypothetical protein